MSDLVHLYTDGSCLVNPNGPGGWAAILVWDGNDYEREFTGNHPSTTNNRMEMTAVIKGLQALKRPVRAIVYSDSQYVINGATKWIDGWIRRNWRNSQGEPVANQDLWLELIEAAAAMSQIDWQWVRGHNGHHYNERCDQLAGQSARQARQ